ncbi:MAG: hypothetical protein ACE363_05665 [Alphaproteobacteria bacterium]
MNKASLILIAVKNLAGGAAVWAVHHIPWTHIGWDVAIDGVQIALATWFCISL